MKRITIVAILSILMMGCATQKRCFDKWPPEVGTDTIVVETIQYRDTIIEIYLPGDTIYKEVALTIPCPEPGDSVVLNPAPFYSDTVRAFGIYSEASAWYATERLRLRLIEYDTIIRYKLDSVIQIKDHFERLYTVEVHKTPPVKVVPWYYKWSLPVALVLIAMIIIIFVLRRK